MTLQVEAGQQLGARPWGAHSITSIRSRSSATPPSPSEVKQLIRNEMSSYRRGDAGNSRDCAGLLRRARVGLQKRRAWPMIVGRLPQAR